MSKMIYDWKRFWYLRNDNKFTFADIGYLPEPDSEYQRGYESKLVTFETTHQIPFLVLLGEPGIGKTETLKSEKKFVSDNRTTQIDESLWVDLRSCPDNYSLDKFIFNSKTFKTWINGNHNLFIYFDSLDKCSLPIDSIVTSLVQSFKEYENNLERLYIRIACREAVWQGSLEVEFKQLWKSNVIEVYKLAPLRKKDVEKAAIINDIDAIAFLKEIEEKRLIPLARKPITLNFLLEDFHKNKQLPLNQAEVYLKGCQFFCEQGLKESFNREGRFAIVAQIAAISIFSNKYSIWIGSNWEDVSDSDLRIQEIGEKAVSSNGKIFDISEAAIKDTVATALFSHNELNRVFWDHQAYAEFLAAHFLLQRKMNLVQIMSLIIWSDGKVIPQLAETAAWLSIMNKEIYQAIVKTDPETLLRSDVINGNSDAKPILVECLLKTYEEERALPSFYKIWPYKELAHPGLANQLRPYICDKSKNHVVREVAIEIAKECKLEELQEDIVNVALDDSAWMEVRSQATEFISQVGDAITIGKLKPLAVGEVKFDPHDKIKGHALAAMWPKYLSVEELFAGLTAPQL